MFYNFRKNKKAFTLVELIVVIAIIAILGAVVGVTVSTFVNRAKKTAATEPLNQLAGMWTNKEEGQTIGDYLKELFTEEQQKCIKVSASGQLSKKALTENLTIMFHDDNCGNYYGVLVINKSTGAGKAEAKDDSSTVTNWGSYTALKS